MNITDNVKDYYGNVLQTSNDLKTNACCTITQYPKNIKKLMLNVNEVVRNTYYGCGLVIPDCLEDCNIVDLGCGTGLDVYILSQLVGENGYITGIDMTPKQIKIAEEWKEWHKNKFNFTKSNVSFILDYIENLENLDIEENSIDVIVSNCVINLCQDKEKVLKQVYNLLKKGGEFYFSDVYSSKRIPDSLRNDKILWGECLSGALYWNDFINLCRKIGFSDIRMVKSNKITINNKELENQVDDINFFSVTYRLFKLDLENDCEDYGQEVIYKGTIDNYNEYWDLDNHHRFYTNKNHKVCGNTWKMLHDTRFKQHFEFIGNFDIHYGIFEGCGKELPFNDNCNDNKCNISNKCC